MRKTSRPTNLEGLKYQKAEGDLSDFESLKRAVKGMDVVFHLAGLVRAATREEIFRVNAEGTRLVAKAVAEANPGVQRLVYVSSIAAAGPAGSLETPKTEAESPAPVSLYGESKLQGERELLAYKDRIPVVIVRPPIVYGPKDKDIFVMIQTVSRRLMPVIQGATPDGNKYYSLIHVRDLVRGIILAGEAPPERVASGEIFFLSEDGIHTYRGMLESMATALDIRPLRFRVPSFAVKAIARTLDAVGKLTRTTYALNIDKLNEILPDFWICSNLKARDRLGFSPQYNLNSGMADAINWYKSRNWI
jgi:nucleoside-diphosphate-sugar epimerase